MRKEVAQIRSLKIQPELILTRYGPNESNYFRG